MTELAKDPSYPWYPRDFGADEPVTLMSIEEEGAYRRLLDFQWLHGSIPADVAQLAKICKNLRPAHMAKLWRAIAPCFVPSAGDPARLQNRRLERIRQEREEHRRHQSASGRRGAAVRWGQKPEDGDPTGNPNGVANGNPTADAVAEGMAKNSSALASALALAEKQELHNNNGTGATSDQPAEPTAASWPRLLKRLPNVGGERWAVVEFLEALPPTEDPDSWCKLILSWLDGLGMPNGRSATPAVLATGLREYLTKPGNYNPRHVRKFIASALQDATAVPVERNGDRRGSVAERSVRAAAEFAAGGS